VTWREHDVFDPKRRAEARLHGLEKFLLRGADVEEGGGHLRRRSWSSPQPAHRRDPHATGTRTPTSSLLASPLRMSGQLGVVAAAANADPDAETNADASDAVIGGGGNGGNSGGGGSFFSRLFSYPAKRSLSFSKPAGGGGGGGGGIIGNASAGNLVNLETMMEGGRDERSRR